MPEPQTPAAPQAGDVGDTPAPGGPVTTPSEPQAGDDTTISLDEARKLRKEAQALRQRIKGYEDAEQAAKDATLSEVELTKKQLATLQEQHDALAAELYEARVYQDVARYAGEFEFIVSADILAKMLLLDDDAIEFEEGRPANVKKLLEKLAKKEPNLVKQQQQTPQGTIQRPGAPAVPAMNPGRSSIQQPGQLAPGHIPRWNDVFRKQG